jgi:hypothetical protein
MKTKLLFIKVSFSLAFFILLNLHKANCQEFYDWSNPAPVTDSVSDNINPYLNVMYDYESQQYLNMVWESSTDSTGTAIYYQDLLSPEGPQLVISSPGIHYTHPRVVDIGAGDTLFYVFFESDQNGNQDIYYVKYLPEGIFSDPLPFAVSDQDEKNFCSAHESLWSKSSPGRYLVNSFAWTRDGVLLTCDVDDWNGGIPLFTYPFVIESNNCSGIFMPMTDLLFWIREEAGSSYIYYSTRPYNGDWSEPSVYFNERNCQNLSGDKIAGQYITWTSPVDSGWQMFVGNTYYDYPDIYSADLEMNEPFDPGICGVIITTEPARQQIGELYMASPYPDGNNYEIFMNDYPYDFGFWNFTNSYTDNRNPDFFLGEDIPWDPGCFYVYLIWESMRNGHWQIFDSKVIMCIGGLDELTGDQSFIRTFPNPFSDMVDIAYTLHDADNVKIEISDLFGRSLACLFTGNQSKGDQQIEWNGHDEDGNELAPGIYLIRLTNETGTYFARIIKST